MKKGSSGTQPSAAAVRLLAGKPVAVSKRRPAAVATAAALTQAEPAPKRSRGRPRKTHAELDEGNRRRLIIDGAARLFRTKGFDATTTRDIAAAASMHSGSPFYHFKSKSALLYAVMGEGMAMAAQSQQQALETLGSDASASEKLRVLIRHHLEVVLGPRSDFIPVMLYEWRSLTTVQRKGISRVKDGYEAVWMPVLDALVQQGALQSEPRVARLFIFGALNWAAQWYTPKGGKTLDQLTEQALLLFIQKA
ncbi:TetR/AcrR family transcriptional regulator [Polaromonas sp.]|uniref:TetR/AcrR family transcriptional regulator n=1 Tax=Polaromonas sp. TaxID=1869339 RepID=UPI00334739A2